jgi:hypothetical protein
MNAKQKEKIPAAANGTVHVMGGRTGDELIAKAICRTCGKGKPLSEMAPDRYAKSGYRSQCRECRKIYDHRRGSDYRLEHREIGWAKSHRSRSRRYGLPLVTELVTSDQVIAQWGNWCYYCEGQFEVVDHRIPVAAGGHHTVQNVVPCCSLCNQKKRWQSDERMIRAFRQAQNGHGAGGRSGSPTTCCLRVTGNRPQAVRSRADNSFH